MKERFVLYSFLMPLCFFVIFNNLGYYFWPVVFAGCFYEVLRFWEKTKIIAVLLAIFHIIGLLLACFFSREEAMFLVMIAFGCDGAAYFSKKLNFCEILSKKILPKTSPGKTLGGLMCGITFGVIIAQIFNHFWLFFSQTQAFMVGLFLSCLAVAGDYCNSKFKRYVSVKHSSQGLITQKMFGESGGFYDTFDSWSLVFWGWVIARNMGLF